MNKKLTIIVKDISEGKEKGFMALIPELNNSIAMGDNLKELFEGVELTIESAQEDGIGIFKKPAKTSSKNRAKKLLIKKFPLKQKPRQKV